MFITHSYLGTTKGNQRCVFYMLFQDYLEREHGLSKQISDELERFARNLGDAGSVIFPFPGDTETTHVSVLDKPWSQSQRNCIAQTPAMLMIDRDFNEFDPRVHQFALFPLAEGSSPNASQFRALFQAIIESVNSDDINPFTVVEKHQNRILRSTAFEAIELKPGFQGMSLDLKKAGKVFREFRRERRLRKHNEEQSGRPQ